MGYSAPTYMRVQQQSGLGPQHLRDETNIKAEWADAGAANSWPNSRLAPGDPHRISRIDRGAFGSEGCVLFGTTFAPMPPM
jgi:hypothetical protein